MPPTFKILSEMFARLAAARPRTSPAPLSEVTFSECIRVYNYAVFSLHNVSFRKLERLKNRMKSTFFISVIFIEYTPFMH